MNVLWLDRAEADLGELVDYLLDHDPGAAIRIYGLIHDRIGLLSDFPGLGRPGRVAGTRELVLAQTPYIVAYTVDQARDAVVILRILHGARAWPREPGPFLEP